MNNCTGYCHDAGSGGLTFQDEDSTYSNIKTGAATTAVCGLTERVVAGDPDKSILWIRVRPVDQDTEDCAAGKMPKDRDPLSAEDAQLIYDWIQGGAQP